MKFKVAVTDYVFPDLETEKRELKKINAELIESAGSDEEMLMRY